MPQPEILIAGAGVIGLSVALELHRLGIGVMVLEAREALAQASYAAAGMLAAHDPANPPALRPLATLAVDLYPAYLDRIDELSGRRVSFQTTSTLQAIQPGEGDCTPLDDVYPLMPQLVAGSHRFTLLQERSVDPRELGPALLAAVRAARIAVREDTVLARMTAQPGSMRVETSTGETLHAEYLVDCMGAWSPAPIVPRKGQMLAVTLPASLPLDIVLRTDTIYIVPRTEGLNAGRAVIGATVEDAGFDTTVHPRDILLLHARATALLPELAEAHFHDSWAGLRPATRDELPILGASPRQPRYVLANGHYRNGILLAPATARVLGQVLTGAPTAIDLAPFSATRF